MRGDAQPPWNTCFKEFLCLRFMNLHLRDVSLSGSICHPSNREEILPFDPVALRTANTCYSFGRSDCSRVKLFSAETILRIFFRL